MCLSPMDLHLMKIKLQTTKFLVIYCFIGSINIFTFINFVHSKQISLKLQIVRNLIT